ncbi:MAG: hypothetical protein KKE53_08525 [Proteobacteria bacterium]|nr:hypothetical protein [Pseudomonadota bacterium]
MGQSLITSVMVVAAGNGLVDIMLLSGSGEEIRGRGSKPTITIHPTNG